MDVQGWGSVSQKRPFLRELPTMSVTESLSTDVLVKETRKRLERRVSSKGTEMYAKPRKLIGITF